MKLHEEFKLYENMWDEVNERIAGELESTPSDRKTGLTASISTGEGEYCITYRVASWPANETAETFVSADSEENAREFFLDYMLDPDNYDAGETVLGESDINIIDIYKKSEGLAEGTKSKKLNEATPTKDPFTWTVGSDSYDIGKNAELRAYIDAAAAEKLPTIAAKHPERPEDDNVWNAYYDVFEELIAHYEARPYVDHQFINRLRVLEDRILQDLHLDEDEQQVQQEVEVLATACIEQFLNKMQQLTAFYKYNIDEPYCQNPIDTIREELVELGMSLAQPNYIVN